MFLFKKTVISCIASLHFINMLQVYTTASPFMTVTEFTHEDNTYMFPFETKVRFKIIFLLILTIEIVLMTVFWMPFWSVLGTKFSWLDLQKLCASRPVYVYIILFYFLLDNFVSQIFKIHKYEILLSKSLQIVRIHCLN